MLRRVQGSLPSFAARAQSFLPVFSSVSIAPLPLSSSSSPVSPLSRPSSSFSTNTKRELSPNETEYQRDLKEYKKEMKRMRLRTKFDHEEHMKIVSAEKLHAWEEIKAAKAERAVLKAERRERRAGEHKVLVAERQQLIEEDWEAGAVVRKQREQKQRDAQQFQADYLISEREQWCLNEEDITEELFAEDQSDQITGFYKRPLLRMPRERRGKAASQHKRVLNIKPSEDLQYEQPTEQWMTDSEDEYMMAKMGRPYRVKFAGAAANAPVPNGLKPPPAAATPWGGWKGNKPKQ